MAKEQNEVLNDEYFTSRGYKIYEKSRFDSPNVEYLFQKRFDDSVGKKYFITVYKWDWTWCKDRMGNSPLKTYEYQVQLYKKGAHDAVDIDCHSSWSLPDVEGFIENLFQTGWFDYYEVW